jgi:hypothetical protein
MQDHQKPALLRSWTLTNNGAFRFPTTFSAFAVSPVIAGSTINVVIPMTTNIS